MSSLFNIGVSGLKAQQAALNIVGQNITNASTPGYSRQRVDIVTQSGATVDGIAQAAGARVEQVTRVADDYVAQQIRSDTALSAELEAYSQLIGQLEGALFDSDNGLDAAMQSFFSAVQSAATQPGDLTMRELVISSGQALADRFASVVDRTWQQVSQVDAALDSSVSRINELADSIAQLNERIAGLSLDRAGGALNSLLDQRELLVKELSTLVSVTISEQDAGEFNVFVGKGQPLVLGTEAARMEASSTGEVIIRPVGTQQRQIITNAISGGELGGVLSYRQEVLLPTQNELGRLAATIVATFNEQHQAGVDLNGEFGGNFFDDVNAPELVGQRVTYLGNVSGTGSNADIGQVNVYIDDPVNAPASDYEIEFSETDPGAYTVTRREDGEEVFRGSSVIPPQTIEFDGLRLEFASGSFRPGDALLVRPFADFGTQMDVVLENPAKMALAMPVRVEADPTNSSDVQAVVAAITDPAHPLFADPETVTPPLLVQFVSDSEYRILDNSDPADPQPLDPDLGVLSFVPGTRNALLPEQGSTVVTSTGPDVTALPVGAPIVSDLQPGQNGYGNGLVQIQRSEADGGGISSVVLNSNASARDIAAALSAQAGVEASAYTGLELTGLNYVAGGTDLSLTINGETLTGFTNLNELADQISSNVALRDAGIVARSDGQTLRLESIVGDDINLHLQGDPSESVTVNNLRGDSVPMIGNGPASYASITVGGQVSTILAPGYSMTTQYDGLFAAVPDAQRADLGFDLQLSGNPQPGDEYRIDFNTGGSADNRNALSLAGLAERGFAGLGGQNFAGVFGSVVQQVGMRASETQVNLQAAQSLLEQSEAYRESISGVNLDEEAANLIRYEQAYNASAQVITVARDIFNVLLQAVT